MFPCIHSLCSVHRGEALDKHVEHVVPVQHVDPDAPRVSSELLPAAGHDVVAGEQLGAVLDAFLLATQPRERYRQTSQIRQEFRVSDMRQREHHRSVRTNHAVAMIDSFQLVVTIPG